MATGYEGETIRLSSGRMYDDTAWARMARPHTATYRRRWHGPHRGMWLAPWMLLWLIWPALMLAKLMLFGLGTALGGLALLLTTPITVQVTPLLLLLIGLVVVLLARRRRP